LARQDLCARDATGRIGRNGTAAGHRPSQLELVANTPLRWQVRRWWSHALGSRKLGLNLLSPPRTTGQRQDRPHGHRDRACQSDRAVLHAPDIVSPRKDHSQVKGAPSARRLLRKRIPRTVILPGKLWHLAGGREASGPLPDARPCRSWWDGPGASRPTRAPGRGLHCSSTPPAAISAVRCAPGQAPRIRAVAGVVRQIPGCEWVIQISRCPCPCRSRCPCPCQSRCPGPCRSWCPLPIRDR
jgi:hypothetical protein